jgi:site-specific recombinase XerD
MINYISRFKKYIEYCRVENIDDLLFNGDTKRIQMMISDFLIHTQGQGLSSATVSHYRTSVKFFYEMNDITALNWKKIAKVMRPFRKAANDRPYSTSEIAKMLEKVDQRGRVILLLMCSSGIREGAVHSLKLAHLERVQDVYKIVVYKNEPDEYVTFCSIECAKAIDDYMDYRKRCGELIKPSAPLVREQFDKNNTEQAANPKNVKVGAIKNIIYHAINDSGPGHPPLGSGLIVI